MTRKNPIGRGLNCIQTLHRRRLPRRKQGPGYCVAGLQPGVGKLRLQFAVKARPRYRSLVPAIILKSFPSLEVRGPCRCSTKLKQELLSSDGAQVHPGCWWGRMAGHPRRFEPNAGLILVLRHRMNECEERTNKGATLRQCAEFVELGSKDQSRVSAFVASALSMARRSSAYFCAPFPPSCRMARESRLGKFSRIIKAASPLRTVKAYIAKLA